MRVNYANKKKRTELFFLEHLMHRRIKYLIHILRKNFFEQWFYPEGASVEVYQFNAVEGGKAFFAIKAPNMTSYTITEYQKVQKPHRLEYLDYFATPQGEKDTSMPGMQILMDFKESNGKTTVTSTSVFPTQDAAQQALDMGVEQGMNGTLDNLEALLEK